MRAVLVSLALAALSALFVGLFVACQGTPPGSVRAVQGWWEGNGPVVPHDGFPGECELCHTSASWHALRDDFVFDHEAETGVALDGAHARAECLRCHNDRGPIASFASQGCAGCHEDVHRGEHGRDCASCHDTDDWRPDGELALHARTRLPLVGAHATTPCWRCHTGADVGNFRNVDAECRTCHLDDYRATTAPDHEAQGFPTSCQECHGFVAWSGAFFSHRGIAAGCVDCHLADYRAAREPDHVGMGFPTQCELCHAPTDWALADFDHRFPLSGDHDVACSRCHTAPNPRVFRCVDCHDHGREEMDHEHRDVGGYVWESRACLDCHQDGRSRGSALHTGKTARRGPFHIK